MDVSLDERQAQLELHFSSLAQRREATNFPIFALEHGLEEKDLKDIKTKLRLHLSEKSTFKRHWLLWTIYASEQGYTYDGIEYWHSFERFTPGWDSSDRRRVSKWFSRFQKEYNGVVPSGPWAKHFSIISQPITHAILPLFLQLQFARTLYNLRYRLASITSVEPAEIGHTVAFNAHHYSTRLEQFLQQEELVGRIVLAAILHKEPQEGEELLLHATLDRIVADLEKVREARAWLKETRYVVKDRFKGIGQGSGPRAAKDEAESNEQRRRELRPNIRPNLLLRYSGDDHWDLVIDVPSFKAVAALNAEVNQFLKQTRCVLNGDPDSKKPAGWAMYGNRRAVLKEWPDPTKPLVEFEESNGIVENIIDGECQFSKGPIWLFRVGRDGIAHEIVSRIVRPGHEYILVSYKEFEDLLDGMYPCDVNCEEIKAIRISVPDFVSVEYRHWLEQRKFSSPGTIYIWPAGLPRRNWDGEGHGDWLTTEQPCLGILPDYFVDSLSITLDDESETIIQGPPDGKPTFIQLPRLRAGQHFLTVRANRSATSEDIGTTPKIEGYLELRIREPESWIPGTSLHTGLVVTGDPYDASLDTFWGNEFKLTVFGPKSRKVKLYVSLENAKGQEIFTEQVCDSTDLPITPQIWHDRFHNFLKRNNCHWRQLDAASGVLMIDGEDLGRYNLRFNRQLLPVRWAVQYENNLTYVRLVDETGQHEDKPECWFYGMETPDQVDRNQDVSEWVEVTPAGGLFIGKSGESPVSIIVSPGITGAGLGGLGVQPVFSHIKCDPSYISASLKLLNYWKTAQVADILAYSRRREVVDSLYIEICDAIIGGNWAKLEQSFKNENGSSHVLEEYLKQSRCRGEFMEVIRRDAADIDQDGESISDWYINIAKGFEISSNAALCSFAIDFAWRPHKLPTLHRDGIDLLLKRLLKNSELLRGARFAAMNCLCTHGSDQTLLPGWD